MVISDSISAGDRKMGEKPGPKKGAAMRTVPSYLRLRNSKRMNFPSHCLGRFRWRSRRDHRPNNAGRAAA